MSEGHLIIARGFSVGVLSALEVTGLVARRGSRAGLGGDTEERREGSSARSVKGRQPLRDSDVACIEHGVAALSDALACVL